MRTKRTGPDKYITIKDVAADAGVSIATVSRAINNGSIRLEKKKRVLQSIKKLNYIPNESARNLAAVNVPKRIAFIVPDIERSYYSEIFKGYRDILQAYKYDPLITSYDLDEQKYKEYNERFRLSSEFKAIIQIGELLEVENKLIVNHSDEHLVYKKLTIKGKVGFYSNDKYVIKYIETRFGLNVKNFDGDNCDFYMASNVNEALHIYNTGITQKPIYTFEDVTEIQKICPNIKQMSFDFYGLGVTLARIAIKKTRKEDINKIIFELKGINEL